MWLHASITARRASSGGRQFRSDAIFAGRAHPDFAQMRAQLVTGIRIAFAPRLKPVEGRVVVDSPSEMLCKANENRTLQVLTSNNGHAMGLKSSGTPFHDSLRSCAKVVKSVKCTSFSLEECMKANAPMLTSSSVIHVTNFCLRLKRIDSSRICFSELMSPIERESFRECDWELAWRDFRCTRWRGSMAK